MSFGSRSPRTRPATDERDEDEPHFGPVEGQGPFGSRDGLLPEMGRRHLTVERGLTANGGVHVAWVENHGGHGERRGGEKPETGERRPPQLFPGADRLEECRHSKRRNHGHGRILGCERTAGHRPRGQRGEPGPAGPATDVGENQAGENEEGRIGVDRGDRAAKGERGCQRRQDGCPEAGRPTPEPVPQHAGERHDREPESDAEGPRDQQHVEGFELVVELRGRREVRMKRAPVGRLVQGSLRARRRRHDVDRELRVHVFVRIPAALAQESHDGMEDAALVDVRHVGPRRGDRDHANGESNQKNRDGREEESQGPCPGDHGRLARTPRASTRAAAPPSANASNPHLQEAGR